MRAGTLLLVSVSAFLLQCNSASRPPLADFKAQSAYYGFKFSDSRRPQVQVVLSGLKLGCDELDRLDEAVTITLNGTDKGAYEILGVDVDALGDAALYASARHDLGDFRYSLAAGAFDLERSVGSGDEMEDLVGRLHVYAPLHPRNTLECGASSTAGSACSCVSEDGKRSSCTPSIPGEDCCAFVPKDHWEVDIDVQAEFCPLLCQATSIALHDERCGIIEETPR